MIPPLLVSATLFRAPYVQSFMTHCIDTICNIELVENRKNVFFVFCIRIFGYLNFSTDTKIRRIFFSRTIGTFSRFPMLILKLFRKFHAVDFFICFFFLLLTVVHGRMVAMSYCSLRMKIGIQHYYFHSQMYK